MIMTLITRLISGIRVQHEDIFKRKKLKYGIGQVFI